MSYFRKSILLFVFMFGVLSGSYAVAALGLEPRPYCTSLEAHVATVIADCKTPQAGAGMAMQGTCRAFNSGNWDDAICAKWNPYNDKNFNGGGYCPEGANGSPCACKNGTNWRTVDQKCAKSR